MGADLKDKIIANQSSSYQLSFEERLRELLPEFFERDLESPDGKFSQKGKFQLDKFISELKGNYSDNGYSFNWIGKDYAKYISSLDTLSSIVPDLKHNKDEKNKNSKNVFISGDNLDALLHLRNAYSNSIKMIYLDPPYNTGNEDFVYNDNFSFSKEDLIEKIGLSEEEAEKTFALDGKNSHAAWLTFMYPRIEIAYQLLKKEGVLFISIDDNEVTNLTKLLIDRFGEQNFITDIIWKGKGGGQDTRDFTKNYEHILVFSKNRQYFEAGTFIDKVNEKDYRYYDEKKKKKYRLMLARKWGANDRREDRPNLYFAVKDPNGKELYPKRPDGSDGCWRHEKKRLLREIKEGLMEFVLDEDTGEYTLYEKKYMPDDLKDEKKYNNMILDISAGRGSNELKKLTKDKKVFDYPKSTDLIMHLMDMAGLKDGDIVLDFFAGSGTTGHAVMRKSIKDKMKLNFILVQLDENLKETLAGTKKAEKRRKIQTQIDYLELINRPLYLDEIAISRIIEAGIQLQQESKSNIADLGFKHFWIQKIQEKTLDEIENYSDTALEIFTNELSMVSQFSSHGVSGEEVLLYSWMIDDAYKFDEKVSELTFYDYKAFYIRDKGKLYMISDAWNSESENKLFEFLIDLENNPVNEIIIYAYSFTFSQIEALKANLKVLDEGRRERIKLTKRY